MSIALVGSPPPAVNYDDLLTGTSSTFRGSNGSWTNSGGTLTHDSTIAYMWPSNNTGSLKLVSTADNQYVEVAVPGTFKAGALYTAIVVVTVEENVTCDLDFTLGLIGTDSNTYSLPSFGAESHTNGRHLAVCVRWVPTAARSGVKLRVTRTEDTGTVTLHVAHAKVFREEPRSTIPILGSPDTSAAAPRSGPTLHVATGTQDTRLGIGGKYNGGITFDYGGGVALMNNSDGTVSVPFVGIGVSDYSGIWMQSELPATPGDLADQGVGIEAGTDYVGIWVSEKDSATVQMYADDTDGYMVQLRHRGIGMGWSASDDGTVNARIDSFFQWAFYVAGALTTGTDKAVYFQVPNKARIDEVRVHVGTAPTGTSLIVDVNDDGTTVFTTQGNRPEIAISGTDDTSGAADGGTAIDKDSVLTIDIDQVGSTIAGADLAVFVRGRYVW